ncbi:hypothetical protein Tco_1303441 [Tanacetum coccineum]
MGKKLVWAPPIPPVSPEQQKRLHMMLAKAKSQAKAVHFRKPPPPLSPEEYRLAVARYRRPRPPTPVVFTPRTVINLSAHTCATRGENDIYHDLVNASDDSVFMILDPATGIADDEFKASMIKRYRVSDQVPQMKRHRESSETVVAQSIPDEVLESASVLKRHRQEDESVDTASVIADEVLGASLLKRHCEEPSESTETVVADLSSPTPGNNLSHSYTSSSWV